jgi:hypothetical protein
VSGLATGSIYASLALALVIVYRSSGVINFAQGELATLSAYVALTLDRHLPFWSAIVLAITASFAGGVVIERIVIRPVERAPTLTIIHGDARRADPSQRDRHVDLGRPDAGVPERLLDASCPCRKRRLLDPGPRLHRPLDLRGRAALRLPSAHSRARPEVAVEAHPARS